MTVDDELIEEGAASIELAGRRLERASTESFDVIVIGGGQAGLSVGHYLARTGARFVILDAHERIGDAWRKRWDSLKLFSPAWLDSLDGMPFPLPRNEFQTKTQKKANELDNKIDDLKVKVQKAPAKAKTDFDVAMQDVNAKRATLDSDMKSINQQSAQAFDAYKAKVDKDIADLKKSIDTAHSKL